ncbi:MAG: hypothetical protein R2838_06955 [Caldilineaceae bacterium]
MRWAACWPRLSGAALVQVFAWLPQVGIPASARAFVIIVLGGMGSMPGTFVGAIIVGLVEALGASCVLTPPPPPPTSRPTA